MMEKELRTLMLGALDGNAESYRYFLQQASSLLRAYFRRRLTAAPDEVEDLLQETLLAIHAQRHTYRRSEPLTPWLYAVARYKMIDCLRRRSRYEALNDPLDDEAEWLAATDEEAYESKKDLGRMLEVLPVHQRLPIQYTKLDGMSVAEAAAMTGMSVSAIKVGVHRGMKALAKIWKEQA
ncbi:RNA polymerase sigma-70 factor, ECF subfamily [Methylobacillus rhizosphaerae]|uniref:RNA polymerase sigma-70 factor, ECF subfamily n=1 Tax=Methylobacillus rhizosphaerae TaxID=551994 RepID=A0A238XLT2_9PROT|nr:sigma-70 family RNA polymerase sigma factor [Methylobacillus rhizosphaerae]SNR59897.1 RNA polymerase sigma-70 factor, ECF subfamily [Methylobacillus rhizosphaerae]